jgi:dihydroorotate dehydrogenase (fumarate)
MVSEILKNGTRRFSEMRTALVDWLLEHDYVSLAQLRGSMNLERCPNPSAYARTNYMRVLGSWRGLTY